MPAMGARMAALDSCGMMVIIVFYLFYVKIGNCGVCPLWGQEWQHWIVVV